MVALEYRRAGGGSAMIDPASFAGCILTLVPGNDVVFVNSTR